MRVRSRHGEIAAHGAEQHGQSLLFRNVDQIEGEWGGRGAISVDKSDVAGARPGLQDLTERSVLRLYRNEAVVQADAHVLGGWESWMRKKNSSDDNQG